VYYLCARYGGDKTMRIVALLVVFVVTLAACTQAESTPDVDEPSGGQAISGSIAPNLTLTFDQTEYHGVEILGNASSDG